MARTKKTDKAASAAKVQEAAEQTQEATQEPEGEDQEPERANAKTSPEDAAALAAQVEAGLVAKLEMSESGEITIIETDVFANLPSPCVYCGPSVKGVARQYTTYQGGIPDALREFIKAHPHALGLIVSTGNFPSMRKRLETPGTQEAELYKAVKERL